jgi:hypothetical protein
MSVTQSLLVAPARRPDERPGRDRVGVPKAGTTGFHDAGLSGQALALPLTAKPQPPDHVASTCLRCRESAHVGGVTVERTHGSAMSRRGLRVVSVLLVTTISVLVHGG